ncbi:MAG TPA: hypothetical protein ENK55_02190 [Actinobacteria bacterium]|nr:hypothetical protein [Actinomycetota bacterium]
MIVGIVAGAVAFVVVLVVVARATKRQRDLARKSLEEEKAKIGRWDIMALVDEEVRELGLADIPGAEGIGPAVLLKVWHRDVAIRRACPDPARLRYVVADDAPAEPDVDHVRLDFEDSGGSATPS